MGDPLQLYRDAKRYDLVAGIISKSKEEISFYLAQARRYPGPALELACGSGRLAIPLAAEQIDITGIDVSHEMLDLGMRRAPAGRAIAWVESDIRHFQLDRKFGFIFIGNNSFSHLTSPADPENCLARVREHLTPVGRFIVEVHNPSLAILTRDPSRYYPVVEYEDPDSRNHVVLMETNLYDAVTQINCIEWRFETDGFQDEVVKFSLRMFYPEELNALLENNGFLVEHKYGGYDETPFQNSSTQQIVVCQLAK